MLLSSISKYSLAVVVAGVTLGKAKIVLEQPLKYLVGIHCKLAVN